MYESALFFVVVCVCVCVCVCVYVWCFSKQNLFSGIISHMTSYFYRHVTTNASY